MIYKQNSDNLLLAAAFV